MSLISLKELEKASPLLRGRAGNALGRGLMRLLSVDKVNRLYERHIDSTGPEFARAVLEDIGIEYEVLNAGLLQDLPSGPFITISNHPYGSVDGVMLVDLFGHLRPDFKVMVNRFLGRIKPLEDNFICVTPTGTRRTAPTKDSIHGIKEAVATCTRAASSASSLPEQCPTSVSKTDASGTGSGRSRSSDS